MSTDRLLTFDEAHWSAVAANYERYAEPHTAQFAREALSLAGGVRYGERVLDVAAGTGALSLQVAEAGGRVLAIDSSPAMVARLRERMQLFARCEARVMDGQALELEDATFDASFSVFGIIGFPDWQRGMSELVRVTRSGGRVIVVTWENPEGAGPMPLFMQAYRHAFPKAAIPSPPPGMSVLGSLEALKIEMVKAGCGEVTVHAINRDWSEPSVDRVMGDIDQILALHPLYAALDDGGRARLREPLRAAFETYTEPDGALQIPGTANVAVGHKLY
ncbi:MAG: class I SAM-dependent methyltransferase [Chroococcidiopsidaceae cyanobacterium CP_BM_RX_35]|nr:class I SAM-dependent methyltransferase [Chroococcidiopsidaceae cyanobacterium CP_BM_RX_35]